MCIGTKPICLGGGVFALLKCLLTPQTTCSRAHIIHGSYPAPHSTLDTIQTAVIISVLWFGLYFIQWVFFPKELKLKYAACLLKISPTNFRPKDQTNPSVWLDKLCMTSHASFSSFTCFLCSPLTLCTVHCNHTALSQPGADCVLSPLWVSGLLLLYWKTASTLRFLPSTFPAKLPWTFLSQEAVGWLQKVFP